MNYVHPRQCIIYKATKKGDDQIVYIGATIDTLIRRVAIHKHDYHKRDGHRGLYVHMRDNGGWDNYTFEYIHSELISSHKEKCMLEQKWIDDKKPICNTIAAYITDDERKAKDKEWRETNKEAISARRKIYTAAHKDEARERHAKWKETHIEHLKTYKAKYYEANKEKHKARERAKYQAKKADMLKPTKCVCGATVTASYLKKHMKTKKHIKMMK